jgi:FdhE protein
VSGAGQKLLTPEEIAVQAGGQVAFLRLPTIATVFAEREMRLRQLSAGHAMRDYLLFVAELCRAQQEVAGGLVGVAALPPEAIDAASRAGIAPFDVSTTDRDPAWRDTLRSLLRRLEPRLAAGPVRAQTTALLAAADAALDGQADRIVRGISLGLDVAAAPLVAAGLQVHLAAQVAATAAAHDGARLAPFGRTDDDRLCPCCGSRPVASVVRIGGDEGGYRYLACSLCSAQWHMVRIKCAHCRSTKGITYQSLDRGGGVTPAMEGQTASGRAVELECCGECGHYLKIVHMERDPEVEPVADDLATLTLDLLADEQGEVRHGTNPLLVFGDSEGEPGTRPDPGGP